MVLMCIVFVDRLHNANWTNQFIKVKDIGILSSIQT